MNVADINNPGNYYRRRRNQDVRMELMSLSIYEFAT